MEGHFSKHKKKICILVKAYPRPSKTYGQTVCCAGITEEGELIRVYPVPYMELQPEQRFNRYDWIEAEVWKTTNSEDWRPESYKADPESIRILKDLSSNRSSSHEIWTPLVSSTFSELKENNHSELKTSLGIIKPEPGKITFKSSDVTEQQQADLEAAADMLKQQQLFAGESQPAKIPAPSKYFSYRFKSGSTSHDMTIHDWEVQAAYFKFKTRYGNNAEEKLIQKYQQELPHQNLHFIMGTQLSRPHQFMIIGLLRSTADLSQGSLF